ncbi:DUF3592 domain-containing protein [Spirosoma soli]|uniref:DUF3592 domain-containing protein n=1 Tax=Spirosoma soli TaxID=1770529 RepID=A0ABW5M6X2_9BACT
MIRFCFLIDTVALLLGLYGFLSGRIPATTPAILAAVFGFIGLNMLLGGFFSYNKTRTWLANTVRTSGEVIDHVGKESVDSFDRDNKRYDIVYYPVVRYQTQTGQLVSFTSSVGSSTPSHAVGEPVGVRYVPANPESAEVDEFMSIWLVTLVLTFIGIPFSIASLALTFGHFQP